MTHLAILGVFATLVVGGVVMVINPKIVGWILIGIAFVWVIGAYITWYIYRIKHKDFTKEIVNLIMPRKDDQSKGR